MNTFLTRLIVSRLQSTQPNLVTPKVRNFSEKKCIKGVMFLGGGLEKLQGSIKEEQYFNSINNGLISKMREPIDSEKRDSYLQNWDEYQKSLDHSALPHSSLMNKHKNCKEEAFFMAENADCVKILSERLKSSNDVNDANIFESDVDVEHS